MKNLLLLVTAISFVCYQAFGKGVSTQVPCDCHTWHNITVMKGTWDVEIAPIFEDANFFMKNCTQWPTYNNMSVARFSINADENDGIASFGYLPTNDDTFDCAYSLTMVRTSDKYNNPNPNKDNMKHKQQRQEVGGSQRSLLFQHMACQFTITAAAPATPDVRAQEYNGALCRWDINPGVGENYYIDYVL